MRIYQADCVEAMQSMPEASVDAIVTDPPYGLGFMDKDWDSPGGLGDMPMRRRTEMNTVNTGVGRQGGRQRSGADFQRRMQRDGIAYREWSQTWAEAALRVAKPGAHLVAFGGTRTFHRLTSALEDAGWEIRDCLVWGYASGFPKSLDVSKAIDKKAGAEREVISEGAPVKRMIPGADQNATGSWIKDNGRVFVPTETAPATPEAAAWDGWGTALKPAWEPIVLARKPLDGTVAKNVLEYGTGGINIDATRVPLVGAEAPAGRAGEPTEDSRYAADGGTDFAATPGRRIRVGGGAKASSGFVDGYESGDGFVESAKGRWPANLVLTDPIFDGDTDGVVGGGQQKGGGNPRFRSDEAAAKSYGGYAGGITGLAPVDTAGTYSRFFLIPKANRKDREPAGHVGERINTHPTVKPTQLMRHLVRLVTPPGGVVLDPFLGSGSTALAAEQEGFDWLGIELDPESIEITWKRLIAGAEVAA